MKTKIFIGLLCLSASLNIKSQTAETTSELTPVPSNIGRFTKNVPKVKNPILDDDQEIRFDVKVEAVNPANGKKAFAVIIQTTNDQLVFENIGGKETARISIYGRITSKDKKTDGFFEETSTITATIEELSDFTKMKPIFLRKVFALPKENTKSALSSVI